MEGMEDTLAAFLTRMDSLITLYLIVGDLDHWGYDTLDRALDDIWGMGGILGSAILRVSVRFPLVRHLY